jgi:hypothetical protein
MSLARRLVLAVVGVVVVFLLTWASLKRPAATLPDAANPPAAAGAR